MKPDEEELVLEIAAETYLEYRRYVADMAKFSDQLEWFESHREEVDGLAPWLLASATVLLIEEPNIGFPVDATNTSRELWGPFEQRFSAESWSARYSMPTLHLAFQCVYPLVWLVYGRIVGSSERRRRENACALVARSDCEIPNKLPFHLYG